MSDAQRSVLITGAGTGLGLGTAKFLAEKGFVVHGTVRSPEGFAALAQAQKELRAQGLPHDIRAVQFDVTDLTLSPQVLEIIQNVDVLINNAGVGAEIDQLPESATWGILDMQLGTFDHALEVNAIAPWRLMTYCVPEMKKRGYGRIVNITSARASMGQWSGNVAVPSYRLSKNMLNAMTHMLGRELQGTNVLVNSLCPGWCQTKMGGPEAPETIEAGAVRIARLAMLPEDGPNGEFFINDQKAPY